MKHTRDVSVDSLRGLAIICMVPANMAPMLAEPHPLWFRVLGSLAAPTFVMLAGFMLQVNYLKGKSSFTRILKRAIQLFAVGAALDITQYEVFPALGMDVLFLIGAGMILCYPLLRASNLTRGVATVSILAFTVFLRSYFEYAPYPYEIGISSWISGVPISTRFMQGWFIDGWFPIFPWIAFMVFGMMLGTFRNKKNLGDSKSEPGVATAAVLLVGGAIGWWAYPGQSYIRAGYSEMFYPVVYGFPLFCSGLFIFSLKILDAVPYSPAHQPLACMGRHSLFIYAAHLVVVTSLFVRVMNFQNVNGLTFAFLLLGMAGILAIGILTLEHRAKKPSRHSKPIHSTP